MMNTILMGALSLSAPLILWLLKFFGTKVTDMLGGYLKEKTNSDYLENVVKRVDDSALRIVKTVYQEYAAGLKKKNGKLSGDEKKTALDMALRKLKTYLGAPGLKELGTVLGLEITAVDQYLTDTIESAVYDAKTGRMAKYGIGPHHLKPIHAP